MPEPKSKPVITSCFVDSRILLHVNNAPIVWYSKRQNTVESSSYSNKFVALRIAKESIVTLRYKLQMFQVPVNEPTNVFCNNTGVVKNTSIPHSMLQKKHNAINNHAIREAIAPGII